MKKYELIKQESGFFRIRALKSFGCVEEGELGGIIEKESNLSQDGNAWVYSDARVYDNARVYGDARVYGNAMVCGNARVYDDARVCDGARVYGNAEVCGCTTIISDINEPFLNIVAIQCEKRLMTVYQDINGNVKCNIGCQKGMTLEMLERRIKEDDGMKHHRKQYVNIMKNAKSILNIE